jgi:hypothetical protein
MNGAPEHGKRPVKVIVPIVGGYETVAGAGTTLRTRRCQAVAGFPLPGSTSCRFCVVAVGILRSTSSIHIAIRWRHRPQGAGAGILQSTSSSHIAGSKPLRWPAISAAVNHRAPRSRPGMPDGTTHSSTFAQLRIGVMASPRGEAVLDTGEPNASRVRHTLSYEPKAPTQSLIAGGTGMGGLPRQGFGKQPRWKS